MNDTNFQSLAALTLSRLADGLEQAYGSGSLEELELEPGLLTIITATGKTFIVSAHSASKQIWLASPISGGLHFTWNGSAWVLTDGRTLPELLVQELASQQVLVAQL